jgi:hypothetical protein
VSLSGPALDRAALVVAPEHLEKASSLVPAWCSVIVAEMGARGGMRLRRIRQGRSNPEKCPQACIGLLQRGEIVGLLAAYGMDKGFRTASRADLAERAILHLADDAIFQGVRRQLKIRAFLGHRYSAGAFGKSAFGGGVDAAAPTFMEHAARAGTA